MKNKFLEVCKTIKRCISRVIRYKRAEQGQDRAFDKVDEAE